MSAPGGWVGDGVSPAGSRRGISYNFHFDCKIFSISYTFSASTGENKGYTPYFQNGI